MGVAFCWDEAAGGFHDTRHFASNNYIENSTDEKIFPFSNEVIYGNEKMEKTFRDKLKR
jgi:hypothetical protein